MRQKMMIVLWILTLGVSVSVLGQTNIAKSSEIREYQSLQEVFRELPPDLQPHKEPQKTNPLLMEKLRSWYKNNAVGHRITIKQREVVELEGRRDVDFYLIVADPPFTLGGVTYKTWNGIRCNWPRIVSAGRYSRLQKQGNMPENISYEQYRTQQERKNQQVESFLATLKLPEKKGGRVIRQGSKVNVTGTIESISADYKSINQKTPYVLIEVELDDVEVVQ